MIDADGYLARLQSFMTRPNVHGATQTITSSTFASSQFNKVGHGYITGQSVALTLSGDGALPTAGEFTASTSLAYPVSRLNVTEYFVIKISDDAFQLASTYYNAMAGTPITFADDISGTSVHITALGGGAGWYLHDDFSRMPGYNFATTDVDTTAETITLAGDYFSHGHKVTFSSTTTVPGGLVAGTSYWLIRVSSGVYKVASTEANAYAGTAINLTSQGTGTHTVTTAEHFVILTDTSSPSANDYNTSPAGCAPRYVKLGYVNSESGYIRMQACLYWDVTNHTARVWWAGVRMDTYDSALFAYQFIGGDEFIFIASQLGSAWHWELLDTFTGITNKLELITKVGILQSGITAGSSVVLQLDTGEASNFTVDKYYYLYDLVGHGWVNYVKVTARDTGADTVTIDSCNQNFPAGAVLTPYAHRYYMRMRFYGTCAETNLNRGSDYATTEQLRTSIPYCSSLTQTEVIHGQAAAIYLTAKFPIESYATDEFLEIGDPDDESYWDCMRHAIGDGNSASSSTTASMNRIYAKTNNILKTARGTMGQMSNTREYLGVDYLNFTSSSAVYVDTITIRSRRHNMMLEIDIEELGIGSMGADTPVLRDPYSAGPLSLLDEPEIEQFVSEGIADRLVYRVGSAIEIFLDDYFLTPGMNNTGPVVRLPVRAGSSREIPIGARPVYPGDTLHLLDFEEDSEHDLTPGINKGLVFVGITSRRSVILGSIADSVVGFSGLGLIEFFVSGQYQDRMA